MISVTLLCVGKSKFPWVDNGLQHYRRLLAPFIEFRVVEVKNVTGEHTPAEQMAKEAALLEAKLASHEEVVCLDREGRQMDSEAFADWLQKRIESGRDLALIVGGPYGIDPKLKERASQTLSFSMLTFPHDLVRLVCAEQLYRAIAIQRCHPYHK